MITYKILQYNLVEKWAQIRYSKPNEPDFFLQTILEDGDFSEDALHADCAERASEAQEYWAARRATAEVTLESDEGNVGNIVVEDIPEFDILTQECQRVKTVDGDTTTYSWNIVALTDEAIGMNIRMQRDDLLHHTDHHALQDRGTMTAAMIAYRQALRDITDQEGYPLSVTWPTEPID